MVEPLPNKRKALGSMLSIVKEVQFRGRFYKSGKAEEKAWGTGNKEMASVVGKFLESRWKRCQTWALAATSCSEDRHRVGWSGGSDPQ